MIAIVGFAQQNVTAANYEQAVKFLGANTSKLVYNSNVNPNWLADGKFWYSTSTATGNQFVLINPTDASRKTAADLKSLLPDATERPTGMGRRGGGLEVLSPDGKKAVFIKDWNLWVKDVATKQETQLTTDGIKDFGYATDNAGWRHSERPVVLWSPDSKKIATFQQDQRHVSDMYLVSTNVGTPNWRLGNIPFRWTKTSSKFNGSSSKWTTAKSFVCKCPLMTAEVRSVMTLLALALLMTTNGARTGANWLSYPLHVTTKKQN
jgi:Tol biopolymer transport system component